MADIKSEVDVCIIGAGTGGAVVAEHAASAKRKDGTNISVVLLEAGGELALKENWPNYSDLPVDMLMNKFNWPFNSVIIPAMLDDDGMPTQVPNQCFRLSRGWGVGGTSLIYYGMYSRLVPYALDIWDSKALPENANGGDKAGTQLFQYSHALPKQAWMNAKWRFIRWRYELLPYYQKNEAFLSADLPLPDTVDRNGNSVKLDTHNAMLLEGAKNFKVDFSADPDLFNELKDYFPADSTGALRIPMYNVNEDNPAYTDPTVPTAAKEVGGYHVSQCAILKKSIPSGGFGLDCAHCGNCIVGCGKGKKLSTAVSYIPAAKAMQPYPVELRAASYVLAVLQSDNPDLPHLVVYGTYPGNPYALGSISVQPSRVVVFAGGAVETPRLWLQSNWLLSHGDGSFKNLLARMIVDKFGAGADKYYIKTSGNGDCYALPPNPNVGKYLMSDNGFLANGIYGKPVSPPPSDRQVGAVDPWVGQVGGSKVDVPHLGSIFYNGAFPLAIYSSTAYGENVPKFGVGAKEFALDYKNTLSLHISCDDEPLPENKVFLSPELDPMTQMPIPGTYMTETLAVNDPDEPSISSLALPVPAVQHRRSGAIDDNCKKLGELEKRILESMNPGNDPAKPTLRASYVMDMDEMLATPIGTMMIGKVVSSDCEAYGADGIYVADASVLPAFMGRTRANTIQALALRTAEALCKKHLLTKAEWRDWANKVGTGHFL